MHMRHVDTHAIEQITPVRHDTAWRPVNTVTIPDIREEAIELGHSDAADVPAYADESGREGMIGAAAVMHRHGREKGALKL